MADCDARCVDGNDLGVDEYAGWIAHVDPLCQEHNPHEFDGDVDGECGECELRYSEHAVRHEFAPSHADENRMIRCGICGIGFDRHN